MTAVYHQGNLRFLYPQNWRVAESETDSDGSTTQVVLESPSGGFWLTTIGPASSDADASTREVMSAIDEQFEDVEWSETQETFHGYESSGFDGFFYTLDLLVCARIRVFKSVDRTVLVLAQSESREFDRMAPVYDAITLSLLQSLTGSHPQSPQE